MIITCPNCHTRYQLAERAIGAAGRKVSCAQCQNSWHAKPEPDPPKVRPKPKLVEAPKVEEKPEPEDKDRMFDAEDEAALDAAFEDAEEETKAETEDAPEDTPSEDNDSADAADLNEAAANKPQKGWRRRGDKKRRAADKADKKQSVDAGLKGKRLKDMQARQVALAKKLPMGRIRTMLRYALLALLIGVIGGGIFFRNEIVREVPDLAGVYEAVGMPVNVIGLEFENVETLRSQQNGVDVMLVTGQVRNVRGGQVSVPPIVVSILDSEGASLYSWSVTPVINVLEARAKLDFEARLNSAPNNAAQVKLAFAEDGGK